MDCHLFPASKTLESCYFKFWLKFKNWPKIRTYAGFLLHPTSVALNFSVMYIKFEAFYLQINRKENKKFIWILQTYLLHAAVT